MRINTNTIFSLIIPSRARTRLLVNCLKSFFGKAKYRKNIEAIILADYDDKSMRDFEYISSDNIKVVFQHQSDKMIKNYNNYGTQCSTGDFVWMLNDDYEMTTQNWDEIIHEDVKEFLKDKHDKVIYIQVDDDTHRGEKAEKLGSCCPILSSETVDIQNGIMPEEIDMWGADIWLYWIFKKLPQNRILNLSNKVKVLHHCRHNNTISKLDSTAQNVEKISKKGHLTDEEFNKYINLFSRNLA